MRHQGWCLLLYVHSVIHTILIQDPSLALHPGGQEAIEAGCCKDLSVMEIVYELCNEVHEDALVVTGGLNIHVEIVVIMVDSCLLLGCNEGCMCAVHGPLHIGKASE